MGDITQYEKKSLDLAHNLADAHSHQSQTISQNKIIKRLPKLFLQSEKLKQSELEENVINQFHILSEQFAFLKNPKSFICYSSSIAIEIVAKFISYKQISLALIDPTFDNIPDIMKSFKIPLIPINEHSISKGNISPNLKKENVGSLFLTIPNNPTGTFLKQIDFEKIVKFCKDNNIIFIIDTTFRLFEPSFMYDQYAILKRYEVTYIVIEDTGKYWPTLDLKVGFLNCSKDIYKEIRDLHSQILLNVSPFILRLLLEYFNDSAKDNLYSIRNLINQNRLYLKQKLSGTGLLPYNKSSNISVEFLSLPKNILAKDLQAYSTKKGVGILSGTNFFWSNPENGNKFIRIALSRDKEYFNASLDQFAIIINDFIKENKSSK